MREIKLLTGPRHEDSGHVALVDDADYELLASEDWFLFRTRGGNGHIYLYARSFSGGGKYRLMHKVICPGAPCVDHYNHNGLDNRRSNLRPTDYSKNSANARKAAGTKNHFKGASAKGRKWRAAIQVDGKAKHLGTFATEVEAARAYDKAARKHFGEFAALNFPKEGERGCLLQAEDRRGEARGSVATERVGCDLPVPRDGQLLRVVVSIHLGAA